MLLSRRRARARTRTCVDARTLALTHAEAGHLELLRGGEAGDARADHNRMLLRAPAHPTATNTAQPFSHGAARCTRVQCALACALRAPHCAHRVGSFIRMLSVCFESVPHSASARRGVRAWNGGTAGRGRQPALMWPCVCRNAYTRRLPTHIAAASAYLRRATCRFSCNVARCIATWCTAQLHALRVAAVAHRPPTAAPMRCARVH